MPQKCRILLKQTHQTYFMPGIKNKNWQKLQIKFHNDHVRSYTYFQKL